MALARRIGLPPRDRSAVFLAQRDFSSRRKFIVALWNAGVDTGTICAETGKSASAVRAVVQLAVDRGEPIRQRRRPPEGGDLQVIADGYRLGIAVGTIAALIGAGSPRTVSHVAARVGLRHRNASSYPLARLAPEQIHAWSRVGNPLALAQAVYCNSGLAEARVLGALDDYAEAMALFPALDRLRIPYFAPRPSRHPRPPSEKIAARGWSEPVGSLPHEARHDRGEAQDHPRSADRDRACALDRGLCA